MRKTFVTVTVLLAIIIGTFWLNVGVAQNSPPSWELGHSIWLRLNGLAWEFFNPNTAHNVLSITTTAPQIKVNQDNTANFSADLYGTYNFYGTVTGNTYVGTTGSFTVLNGTVSESDLPATVDFTLVTTNTIISVTTKFTTLTGTIANGNLPTSMSTNTYGGTSALIVYGNITTLSGLTSQFQVIKSADGTAGITTTIQCLDQTTTLKWTMIFKNGLLTSAVNTTTGE